jgi:NNP family nitrate/nitrite transporter-like MFS transporter
MQTQERDLDAPRAGRVLLLSTASFTVLFAVWLMLGVLGVPIKDELRLDNVQFGWLTAMAVLSGSIFRLPLGILTDRLGGRVVMTALLVATALPTYFMAGLRSFEALLACTFLFGIAGNSFSIGIAWNAAWFPRERQGLALGVFGAGNVGASVTKLLGPALIVIVPSAGLMGGAIPGGWRFIPVLYAVVLIAMGELVWLHAPKPDRRPGKDRSLASQLAPLRAVRVWRFGLYYVVVFGGFVALSLWLPNYYKTVYGFSLGKAALFTALFIFPASLLRPVGGWLSDRFGARPVTYTVFTAMLLACIPLCAPDGALGFRVGPSAFFLLIEVLGVSMGVGMASVFKYIPEYFPKDVGAVGGLVGTLGAFGGFLLPLGFGYLESSSGRPNGCFWILAVLIAWSFLWLHLVVTGLRRREVADARGLQTS